MAATAATRRERVAADALLTEVAAMSDEEAEQALMRELGELG